MDLSIVEEYLEKALDRAHRLNVGTVVFGSGGAKNVPDGFPMDKVYLQVMEETKMVASMAKK